MFTQNQLFWTCQKNKLESIINDIQSYGSSLNVVTNQDTIIASQIISYQNDTLIIDLLNVKWSNFRINKKLDNGNSLGANIPYSVPINQIDCIIEVNRPKVLKEYAYIGFTALVFWGIITIFQSI